MEGRIKISHFKFSPFKLMEIVFATANKNKIKEIQGLIPSTIKVLGLNDINCTEEIPETQATIEGNASQKAG